MNMASNSKYNIPYTSKAKRKPNIMLTLEADVRGRGKEVASQHFHKLFQFE